LGRGKECLCRMARMATFGKPEHHVTITVAHP
jgi:hypothetical protein